MVPLSAQPPPGPTVPQARDRRPLASSPGGGRHSGPKARGRCIAAHVDGSPLGAASTRPHGATGKGTPTSGQFSRWGPAPRAEGPRAAHRHSRRRFPSRRSLHQAPRCHRQGTADLWPVLPVGAGTAGRRPAGDPSSSALTARRTPSLSPAFSPRHPVSADVPGSCPCSAPTATAESSR